MAGGLGAIGPVMSLASSAGGGKGGGGSSGGASQQDLQNIMFQHHEGQIAANQFGAQTGTGNYTGTVMAQNANDIQTGQALGQLQQQQETAALNAQQNASQANGLLGGLGGNFGSTGGTFSSSPASSSFGAGGQ